MMGLWWLGNIALIIVVVPVMVVLLQGLLKPVVEIRKHADAIHGQAGGIDVALDAVPGLLQTRDLVKQVGAGLARYANAVDRLL